MKKNDKIKATLTIQQSIELQKLGIDIRLASWYEPAGSTAPNGCGGQTVTNFPVFTIADILSILPKEIVADTIMGNNWECALTISWNINRHMWYCGYELVGRPIDCGVAPELIDSLYQLLIWAIEHSYVNTKDEKK